MKKYVMTALLSLALAGSVMASDGTDLDRNKVTAETLVNAVFQANGTYDNARSVFSPDLAGRVTADNFATLKKGLGDFYGAPTKVTFRALEKFDDGDRLTYVVDYRNGKSAVVAVIFLKNAGGRVSDFFVQPVQPAPQR